MPTDHKDEKGKAPNRAKDYRESPVTARGSSAEAMAPDNLHGSAPGNSYNPLKKMGFYLAFLISKVNARHRKADPILVLTNHLEKAVSQMQFLKDNSQSDHLRVLVSQFVEDSYGAYDATNILLELNKRFCSGNKGKFCEDVELNILTFWYLLLTHMPNETRHALLSTQGQRGWTLFNSLLAFVPDVNIKDPSKLASNPRYWAAKNITDLTLGCSADLSDTELRALLQASEGGFHPVLQLFSKGLLELAEVFLNHSFVNQNRSYFLNSKTGVNIFHLLVNYFLAAFNKKTGQRPGELSPVWVGAVASRAEVFLAMLSLVQEKAPEMMSLVCEGRDHGKGCSPRELLEEKLSTFMESSSNSDEKILKIIENLLDVLEQAEQVTASENRWKHSAASEADGMQNEASAADTSPAIQGGQPRPLSPKSDASKSPATQSPSPTIESPQTPKNVSSPSSPSPSAEVKTPTHFSLFSLRRVEKTSATQGSGSSEWAIQNPKTPQPISTRRGGSVTNPACFSFLNEAQQRSVRIIEKRLAQLDSTITASDDGGRYYRLFGFNG